MQIAKLKSASERGARLTDLKTRSGVNLGDLKADLKELQKVLAAEKNDAAASEYIREMANDEGWFMLMLKTKVKICKFTPRRINGHTRQDMIALGRQDFEMHMSSRPNVGELTASTAFLTHPDRPEYEGVITDPDAPPVVGKYLNLYSGWGVIPKKGDATPFLNHIREIICSGDDELYDYVVKLVALTVQYPGRRSGVLMTLIGDEGVGKGVFLNTIYTWFGQHGFRAGKPEQLTGKHNAHLVDVLFVLADEAFFAGDAKNGDALKGLITEPTITIEPKFMDASETDNKLSVMASTNHDHAVRMSPSDRRNIPIKVSDARKQDASYFGPLIKWLEGDGKAFALHHFLHNVDVSDFDAQRDRPNVQVMLDQKMATLSHDWLFWRECIDMGHWFARDGHIGTQPHGMAVKPGKGPQEPYEPFTKPNLPDPRAEQWYLKEDIYENYLQWHNYTRQRGTPVSGSIFWKNVRKWAATSDECFTRPRNDDGSPGKERVLLPPFDGLEVSLHAYLST